MIANTIWNLKDNGEPIDFPMVVGWDKVTFNPEQSFDVVILIRHLMLWSFCNKTLKRLKKRISLTILSLVHFFPLE